MHMYTESNQICIICNNWTKPYCITESLHYCITPLLYFGITVILYHSITVLLFYCFTALLHYCITRLLYYCIIVLLYYCIYGKLTLSISLQPGSSIDSVTKQAISRHLHPHHPSTAWSCQHPHHSIPYYRMVTHLCALPPSAAAGLQVCA